MSTTSQSPEPAASSSSASLFVGDLDLTVTEGMLFGIFNTIGPVASIRVCRDAASRRSLGNAYVNYRNATDAERALEQLNYSMIKNRTCRITWAQREPTGNIFVKNLDQKIGRKGLYDTFAAFGNVLSCKVVTDKNGLSKGHGFIQYATPEAAEVAIKALNGMLLNDKKIHVGHPIQFPPKERKPDTSKATRHGPGSYLPTDTDVVSLSALHVAATVGPDHWHRTRPQPIAVSLRLHLTPPYLDTPGQSDNVIDSLHYGHLTKAIEQRIGGKGERSYAGPRALADDVTDAAFSFAKEAVGKDGNMAEEVLQAVQIVLELPKQILLAGGFEVELTTRVTDWTLALRGTRSGEIGTDVLVGTAPKAPGAIVRVKDLTLPVIIGVNPPERLAKQRVVTHLTFFEAARTTGKETVEEIDYPAIVQQIATEIESSTYLTLEKLVYEVIQIAYRATDAYSESNDARIDAITVQCQKPSALSFAEASGVEMTRTREALRRTGR